MYTTSNPRMEKKQSVSKKGSHFHFDANDSGATDTQQTIVDQRLKRQQEMIQTEKHQKIVKKPKIDEHSQDRYRGQSYGMRQSSQPNYQQLSQFSLKKQPRIQQNPQEVQQKSLELLSQLLFHPDVRQQALINPQVANKWILSPTTPIKIKSFLALYMILHHFDSIGFGFRRTIKLDGPQFKKIEIDKVEDRPIVNDKFIRETPECEAFRQNEFKNYLADYLEWLIWINENTFDTTKEDFEFWAMALNNCEKTSMQLLRSTNQRQSVKNVLLASFLMNAQDSVFRSTSELPRTKNISYMDKEDLTLLPPCHWLLGLNFSVKYFYQKSLNERVSSSLENIDKNELKEFYHEYQLLSSYFLRKSQPFEGVTLSDNILQWLAMNSECRQEVQNDKKLKFNLIKKICSSFMTQALPLAKDINQVKNKLLLSVQLLERDMFLSQNQKTQLFSSILYKDQKIAYKLGKQFPQAINNLEHKRQPTLSHLSQRLTKEYSQFYSHLILSEQTAIQNDLLTQFKHLTNISFHRQTPSVIEKILRMASSFNLLTHWNKDVLKTFVFILDKYLQRFDQFLKSSDKSNCNYKNSMMMEVEESQDENKNGPRSKQKQELQTLCSFLKIHLNLEPLNLENLKDIIRLINSAQNSKSQLPFELRTISFIKKNLLNILFAKNGFNQALLLSIKKMSQVGKVQKQQKMNIQTQNKHQNILEELKQMAQGIKHFEDQIDLLSEEAKNISIIQSK